MQRACRVVFAGRLRVASAAMDHNFTGPSFTIGVEEEMMIVDAESYALVNAIESLLADAGARNGGSETGDIKPELMESVLEIATKRSAEMRSR